MPSFLKGMCKLFHNVSIDIKRETGMGLKNEVISQLQRCIVEPRLQKKRWMLTPWVTFRRNVDR
jgi:hypothetical protein